MPLHVYSNVIWFIYDAVYMRKCVVFVCVMAHSFISHSVYGMRGVYYLYYSTAGVPSGYGHPLLTTYQKQIPPTHILKP